MTNFIEELRWRGMLQDIMPGTEELLQKSMVKGYIGFDPTSNSLGVGNLVQIMTLLHFQKAGHKPIVLIGGATGMVGDPSGKSQERNLLSEETLNQNKAGVKKQLEKFLNFSSGPNAAEMVDNYDWFKDMTFLDFIREAGKYITINYMLAKDSVQKRLDSGMSFTEFTYQLVQGYDFYYLWKNKGIQLQMGGSDQWGNIVTGTEFIRRKAGGEAFAVTTPLIKKADGTKFGKTESGNIWLDPEKTSPYQFYQFWLNASDADASTFIRIFTLLEKEEIINLEKQHAEAPHLRMLQKTLAKDITVRVHGLQAYENAVEASEILFGKGTSENLGHLSEQDILAAFEGVPRFIIPVVRLNEGINIIDLLATESQVFPSKGEARKMIQAGGLSINKEKMADANAMINSSKLIRSKFLLVQKGKKNYYLLIAS
jgi:tyrosyl-tRNA synthetase